MRIEAPIARAREMIQEFTKTIDLGWEAGSDMNTTNTAAALVLAFSSRAQMASGEPELAVAGYSLSTLMFVSMAVNVVWTGREEMRGQSEHE